MKLMNEGSLKWFATCSSHVSREGWLYMKGVVNKSFQKRWFGLKGNLLFYFERAGAEEPIGVIILEGYTVQLADSDLEGYTFQIVFDGGTSNRKYILQAESQQVMEDWMRSITCASYDYMKVMIAELRAKLDDLNAQENAQELSQCQPTMAGVAASALQEPATTVAMTIRANSPARLNPFNTEPFTGSSDNVAMGTAAALDPFGQKPFSEVTKAPDSSLQVPAHVVRKKKGSPLLSRAKASSPRASRKSKAPEKAVFRVDKSKPTANAFPLQGSQSKPRDDTNFSTLHEEYGSIIQNVLSSAHPSTHMSINNENKLIEF